MLKWACNFCGSVDLKVIATHFVQCDLHNPDSLSDIEPLSNEEWEVCEDDELDTPREIGVWCEGCFGYCESVIKEV
jgi:hypothetical protein